MCLGKYLGGLLIVRGQTWFSQHDLETSGLLFGTHRIPQPTEQDHENARFRQEIGEAKAAE